MRVVKYKTKLTSDKKATLTKEFSINYPEMDNHFDSPDKVIHFATHFLRMNEETEEYMYMVCLNNKLTMTSLFEISHGNVNSSIVTPREVFQKALLANAVSIILIHNHPSGDSTPSYEDIEVTKRLVDAGKLIGICVLDHIIIGTQSRSLKEKGYL